MTSSNRVRIRFSKEGDLRFISHRDVVRAMERMFRRARLDLAMTQGFHPRPQMNFPAALALGIEARQEVAELVLAQPMEREELWRRLRETAPPGLTIHDVQLRDAQAAKARVDAAWYELVLPADRREAARQEIDRFLERDSWEVFRGNPPAPHEFRSDVLQLQLNHDALTMKLRTSQHKASARPQELLAALGLDDWQLAGWSLVRSEVELAG